MTKTLPAINDPVSFSFNGDYRPCGVIVKISKNHKKITTSDGSEFYKKGDHNLWMMHKTWFLVKGHIDQTNPEF